MWYCKNLHRNHHGIKIIISKSKNIYCSPWTFQTINIRSLKFPKLKGKINFGSKFIFPYYLVHDLRERWEKVVRIRRLKEKNYVGNNYDHKNDKYWCQIVLFNEKSSHYVFFLPWNCLEKKYLSSKRFFLFRIDFKFWDGFLKFLRLWMSLSGCLRCFLVVLDQ